MQKNVQEYYFQEFSKLQRIGVSVHKVVHLSKPGIEPVKGLSLAFDNWSVKRGIYDVWEADEALTLLEAAREQERV